MMRGELKWKTILFVTLVAVVCTIEERRILRELSLINRQSRRQAEAYVEAVSKLKECRVVLENPVNYHFEVIEGVIMRYPIPWGKLKCDSTTVVFDVVHRGWGPGSMEMEGWLDYFSTVLAGSTRDREDGVRVKFGRTIPLESYQKNQIQYDAVIGVSCTNKGTDPRQFVRQSDNHYCVMHRLCGEKNGKDAGICDDLVRQRSCWVSPMSEGCYFLPTELPQFNTTRCARYQRPELSDKVNICVSGRSRNHDDLAKALALLRPKNMIVSLHQRDMNIDPYIERGVEEYVRVIRTPDFMTYQKSMSQCDAILPLLRPEEPGTENYFPPPVGRGKLSGCITQALAYKLPIVIHEDLQKIYRNHLNGPVYSYTTPSSFQVALSMLIKRVKKDYDSSKELACLL